MEPYWAEHQELRVDAVARGAKYFDLEEERGVWRVSQTVLDPEEHLEWRLRFSVDLATSREQGGVCLTWEGLDAPT
jgi:hypothetical protein